jgi:uncharacterized protein
MSQTENAPTPKQIAIFQALEEIDKDPCIGHRALEEKDVLFEQFFSKEAKMGRLQRIRQRKEVLEQQLASLSSMEQGQEALEQQLASLLSMEKQLVKSLQE